MANELILPPGGPAAIFDKLPQENEDIGAGIGVGLGYGVIGASGRCFKLQYQGESHRLTTEDGSDLQVLDVIILRAPPGPSHTWYKQGYQPGSEQPPDCASTDGEGPDDASPSPQSPLCQTCRRHEWKTLPSGRKGRECSDSLRLVVFPIQQQAIERAIGRRISEAVMLRVPAASMRGAVEFMGQVKSRHKQVATYGYVTRITMKKDVQYAQFEYQVVGWPGDDAIRQFREMREEPVAYRILGKTQNGLSLVRRAANNLQPGIGEAHALVANHGEAEAQWEEVGGMQARNAIGAMQAEQNRREDIKKAPQQMQPVEDAPLDMAALVEALRPRPPGA